MPEVPAPSVGALFWHIEFRANTDAGLALAIEVRRLLGVMQALPEHGVIPDQSWPGWQQLLDLSLNAEPFVQSGQIKQTNGVLPWLFCWR